MNPITLQQFLNNPDLRRRLYAQAHRERARSVHTGLLWLFDQAKKHVTPRIPRYPARWIARLG